MKAHEAYDFAKLDAQLKQAADEYMHRADGDYPEHLRLSEDEMVALFQHYLDTDTLPDNPSYFIMAGMMRAEGKIT